MNRVSSSFRLKRKSSMIGRFCQFLDWYKIHVLKEIHRFEEV